MTLQEKIKNKHSGDDKQLEFIFANDNRIIVTAPAGCGKTTAMISRIAWGLTMGQVPTNKRLLAMTFSINAAVKIKTALAEMMPDIIEDSVNQLKKVDVANYHNFAMKLLFKHGYLIHQKLLLLDEFNIVSESSELLDQYLTDTNLYFLKEFRKEVSTLHYTKIQEMRTDYIEIVKQKLIPNKILTFDSLLIFADELLNISSIKNFYQQYYQLIIVDEFQDTNYLAFCMLNKLIGNNAIVLLGDDLQKIYGFMGAMQGLFGAYQKQYNMKWIEFENNYRFSTNQDMKDLDKFIRSYCKNYSSNGLIAKIKAKTFSTEELESTFIARGVKQITNNNGGSVSILVRVPYQADSIVKELDDQGIKYFNALFNDTDVEYIAFHKKALDVLYAKTIDNKATKKILDECIKEIQSAETELKFKLEKSYIFNSLLLLMRILFAQTEKETRSSKERFEKINFVLSNNGLKHMMEYVEEPTVITTIHSAKGLEWEYVIIPKLMSYSFPTSNGLCKKCTTNNGGIKSHYHCEFRFTQPLEKDFKEELSTFYVGITRARKEVFATANNGDNPWGFPCQRGCFLTLEGLINEDFEWDDIIS